MTRYIKNSLQQQKQNFFHDRRLEGTGCGYLVTQPPILHLFAHKSFRSTSEVDKVIEKST